MSIDPGPYLTISVLLFSIGLFGVIVRRNLLIMFMCVELMLNAANLAFVTFSRILNDVVGQSTVFFVMVVAAAEVVVGLGIVVSAYRLRAGTTSDDFKELRG